MTPQDNHSVFVRDDDSERLAGEIFNLGEKRILHYRATSPTFMRNMESPRGWRVDLLAHASEAGVTHIHFVTHTGQTLELPLEAATDEQKSTLALFRNEAQWFPHISHWTVVSTYPKPNWKTADYPRVVLS